MGVDPDPGLSDEDAVQRLQRVGANALPECRSTPRFVLFLRQCRGPLIYLLLAAAIVAFVLGHRTDAWVILAIVTANAVLGAFQEGRAERSLAALARLSAALARVVRSGRERIVEARHLVPGDVLLLAAGDAIAADARLIEAASLRVAAAALTGESLPVGKYVDARIPLADRGSMVYAGTHVAAGRGRAIVVSTGLATEVGKIATLTATAVEPQIPLARRLAAFGRVVTYLAAALSLIVIALGVMRGLPMSDVLMVAAGQLVAMVPEGLPVAVMVALAFGARRIARHGALVRKLVAIETLGSTSVICTDKTGTLTRNEMCVTRIHLASGVAIDVTGSGYAPVGELRTEGASVRADDPDVRVLAEAVVLCNDAGLAPPSTDDPRWKAIGDPTEASLLAFAAKAGVDVAALRASVRRLAEIPFDAGTKMMAIEYEYDGGPLVVLKGAPELVLERCGAQQSHGRRVALDANRRRELASSAEAMAAEGLRVLAVAVVASDIDLGHGLSAIRDATVLGLVGQSDPPRDGALEAIATCHAAGIRVVMVTGDHEATARAVARMLGILRERDEVLGGAALARLDDASLERVVDRITVFARVHPAQKLRIVKALQARGRIVAMTGDGVSDAPALASADVGIAMRRSGTEVAKMAAKVVLIDDDFTTIVRAVAEGRAFHRNIEKLILCLVSTAFAGVLVFLSALTLGFLAPLAPVHVLWVNLVTGGVVAIPLGTGTIEGEVMARPPVSRREHLVAPAQLRRMLLMVPMMAISTLGWFVWRLQGGVSLAVASTEAFTVFAVCQWWNALNCRSERESVLRLRLGRDRWLLLGVAMGVALQVAVLYTAFGNRLLHTAPLPAPVLGVLVVVASAVLWAEEVRKLAARWAQRARVGLPRLQVATEGS